GIRLATLESVFRLFPLAACNIEIKQESPPIVEEVVRLVERLDAQHRVLLAAEHDSIMQRIRRHCGEIVTSFAAGEVADFIGRAGSSAFAGYNPPGRALQIPASYGDIRLVTDETVAAAHELGLEMHVWTVNQRDEMDALLALGVDGIISDLPGLARVAIDHSVARRAT
ncbi:MAG TPA: glycerophosphodiester phosphodiesterase family protein, partial [Candidatus Acidoferrales bacterium]|nr:glycerophosphodiester phosphodiesterase family protein [Candidatus Acidoferrales bacterium]